MAMSPRQVELHIDELVLHSTAPVDQRALVEAFERELRQLVARQGVDGLLARRGSPAQQTTAPITLAADAQPGVLGVEVARAVHRGWR